MKALSGREFARLVGDCCVSTAATTSMESLGSVVRLSIPIHGNRPLKLGLLRHLAKLAEISDEEMG